MWILRLRPSGGYVHAKLLTPAESDSSANREPHGSQPHSGRLPGIILLKSKSARQEFALIVRRVTPDGEVSWRETGAHCLPKSMAKRSGRALGGQLPARLARSRHCLQRASPQETPCRICPLEIGEMDRQKVSRSPTRNSSDPNPKNRGERF